MKIVIATRTSRAPRWTGGWLRLRSVARYLQQLDTADRQEPSEALKTRTSRLKEKIAKLKEQMQRLEVLKVQMLSTPDQQISLTDPDSRSMATSGRGSGIVGYNVQIAVDTEHHLIITHEVTNIGTDRSQLAHMAKETKAALEVENLDAVADRGYFQQRGDPGVRGGRHHSHAAKADDLALKGGRTLRQARLTWPMRTFTFVPRKSGSPTPSRPKKTDYSYAAT